MKLKLKNFRTYTEKEFDFGEEGIVLLSGQSGSGKCLSPTTPVLYYNGTIHTAQQVKEGDILMGDDSGPRIVISTTSGEDLMYKITPEKGKPYTVNSHHILTLSRDGEHHDIPIRKYIDLSTEEQKLFKTFHVKTDFPHRKITENPYTEWKNPETMKAIKTNSIQIRSEALAGIIDDIGKSDENCNILIHSHNLSLLADIDYITQSLGLTAHQIDPHTIEISGHLNSLPLRKSHNLKDTDDANHKSFTVSCLGFGNYCGFQITGKNSRFLLGDFTVTHNSTVMMAVLFALYGRGTKLCTSGKTSCQVDLEFENLKITRTKRPNRLVVYDSHTQNELEDAAAQGVINEKFGTGFDVTSYLQQNAFNSFIMMGPLEKLEFLEKFAFQGVDLGALKIRCQAAIKKRNEELISTTSQLEMANEHLKTLVKPRKLPKPKIEAALKDIQAVIEKCGVVITRKENKLALLSQELTDLKIYTSNRQMKSSMVDQTNAKIVDLEHECSAIGYEGDEKLSNHENDLKLFLTQKELILSKERYSQDKSRLESMIRTETEEKDAQIELIKDTLWKEYTQEEADSSITEYRVVIKELEMLHRMEKSLESYRVDTSKLSQDKISLEKSRKDLELKKNRLSKLILQQELYECPSCNVQLRLHDDELKLHDEDCEILEESTDDLKREIAQLSKTISKLEASVPEDEMKVRKSKEIESECKKIRDGYEDEIPERDEVVSSLEYLQEYKRTQKELEKKLQNLEKPSTSSSLQKFKEQLARQKERIKELESSSSEPTPNSSEEELREKIQDQKQAKDRLSTCNRNLAVLRKELASFREGLAEVDGEYSSKYSDVRTESEIESEIESVRVKIQALVKHREKYRTYSGRVETYERSVEEVKRYKEWEVKVRTLTEEEVKNRKRYASAMTLKEKILEAESLAIANVISSINIHAQEYLDLFFPVDPIVVRLEPFKKTKKKTSKPQITLEIDYKGMEADLSMLSGGELARVVLAYTLALSEIFNSPLIMLDECTASLDQDMTSNVMEGIRKNFSNKLVVVIAHQVISADFDRIIQM